MFSPTVCEKIGNYVYRLIDPRNGETFYVGQGQGNRVFNHIAEQVIEGEYKTIPPKLERIRAIHRAGLDVVHVIHRHEIPKEAINDVEAALIDSYPGLTNIQSGYNSSSTGPMHTDEIIKKYDLPELDREPPHKLILLNINSAFDESGETDFYKETHLAWRLSLDKAKQADYVLAVARGVVKQVFVADRWLPATPQNFPDYKGPEGRYGFVGRIAPDDICEYYVGQHGKRITNPNMKHSQNPVRYWNI